jgi:hypothetical protein
MFAQWSLLSAIAPKLSFFSFAFKIDHGIRIHDKGFPTEAEIEDMRAFAVSLLTIEVAKIIYAHNTDCYWTM